MSGQMAISYPDSVSIVVAKFIACLVLHWICLPQIRSSLDCMKFVVNHSFRFESPFNAYLGAFLHMTASVTIEMLNFLSLLSVPDLFEFVRDFTALIIIADFETLLAMAVKEDCFKLLVASESFKNVCLKITRTSNLFADDKVL